MPTSDPGTPDSPATGDDAGSEMPMSMTASAVLSSATLPGDARSALATLATTLDPPTQKITVRFHAIGDAPPLKQKVAKVSASHTFATIVKFLRKRLYGGDGATGPGETTEGGGSAGLGRADGLFCYVNSVFAPGLDEGVGNLWRVGGSYILERMMG
jgi:ubiquitin-like protein ATG12